MDKNDFLFEQWKMASELHKHEDNLLWQRFSYFVTLTGILASGLVIFLTADIDIEPKHQYLFLIIVSLFGAIISLAFAFIFKRAYLYHILRVCQAEEAEKRLKEILHVVDETSQSVGEKKPISQFSVYRKGLASRLVSNLRKGEDCADLWKEDHPSEDERGWLEQHTWCFTCLGTYNAIFNLSLLMVLAWGLLPFVVLVSDLLFHWWKIF
jgi:hypothetical protein